jgi:hypothetical protein
MSAVERESIDISLAGHTFTFERLVRKKSRAAVRDVMKLLRKYPSLQKAERTLDGAIEALTAADDVLEFFAEWVPGVKEKGAALDDATEKEIMGAFQQLSEFVLAPFEVGVPVQTDTPKPEPTS